MFVSDQLNDRVQVFAPCDDREQGCEHAAHAGR
jgi:hypothetical protein